VSEPEGSANWFPLNDHPTDKAAFTFVVTMPAGLEAISNGRLVGNKTHGRWTTCVWNALDYGEIADGSLARQTEIIDFLASQFGPYPFSSGGGIVDDADNLFFALENQTRSIYPKDFFTDPISGDFVVSTRTPTSGTATAWLWPSGSTCGSTRVRSCWLESMRA
jgi:hypothetical protein